MSGASGFVTEETPLRDSIVKAVMDWVEDGCELDIGALGKVQTAAAEYRTWLSAQPREEV